MPLAPAVFGALKPIGSPESLEQLQNMPLVTVAFGLLKPTGSPESMGQL